MWSPVRLANCFNVREVSGFLWSRASLLGQSRFGLPDHLIQCVNRRAQLSIADVRRRSDSQNASPVISQDISGAQFTHNFTSAGTPDRQKPSSTLITYRDDRSNVRIKVESFECVL